MQNTSFSSIEELLSYATSVSKDLADFLNYWFDQSSFVEVNTSGSTGSAKKIKLQKKHMQNSAKTTCEYFGLGPKTKALLCMSVNYIAGKMMLVRALEYGWHLDVVTPCSNPLTQTSNSYDFCAMVTYQLHHSLEELDKVNTLIVGGGEVSNELLHKIQFLKTNIYATYGMTETVTHIAVKKLNNGEQEETSFFKVLPNIKIDMDYRGCLVIDASQIADEKITTNDLVKIISTNEFEWLGRIDNVINSGGIKHIPEQLEKTLNHLIGKRFFITGLKDQELGQKIALVVEGEEDKSILQKIKDFKGLNRYERPKEVFFVDKFTETPTGKIKRLKTISDNHLR